MAMMRPLKSVALRWCARIEVIAMEVRACRVDLQYFGANAPNSGCRQAHGKRWDGIYGQPPAWPRGLEV